MEGVCAVIAVNKCAVKRRQNGGAKDGDVADVDALALCNVADEFEAAKGFKVLIRVIHLLKIYQKFIKNFMYLMYLRKE